MRSNSPNEPWAAPPAPAQNQKLNLKWLLLLVPLVLCCLCGGGGSVWGMGLYRDEVCEHLKKAEKITDVTGPITTCKVNYGLSMNLNDFDTFVFDLAGSTGNGKAFVKSDSDAAGNEVYQGILFVPKSGSEILVEGERPPTK